jgi:putative acetyltransferase
MPDEGRIGGPMDVDAVTIRPLESAGDAEAFRELNAEWISRYFSFEERDRRQLDDPFAAYIDPGGVILIADVDGRPIGCVALAPDGTGAWELSKMAVAPESQGYGVGRKLVAAAIDHSRARRARSLYLGSSKKLASAVHLYEALGFKHVPRETLRLSSTRVDVCMELVLQPD